MSIDNTLPHRPQPRRAQCAVTQEVAGEPQAELLHTAQWVLWLRELSYRLSGIAGTTQVRRNENIGKLQAGYLFPEVRASFLPIST